MRQPPIRTPIHTARLEIRPFAISDAEDRYALFRDPLIWKYLGGFGPANALTKAASDRQLALDIADEHQWVLAARDRNSAALVGTCVLRGLDDDFELILGFIQRRRRYGTEAIAGISAEILRATVKGRLVCRIKPDNDDSIAFVESQGFLRAEQPENEEGLLYVRQRETQD